MSFVSGEFSPADNMQEVGNFNKFKKWADKKAKNAKEAAKRTAEKAKEAAKRNAEKAKEAAKRKYDNINKKKQIKNLNKKKKPAKKPAKGDEDIARINKLIEDTKELGDMFEKRNPSVAKEYYKAVIDMYEGYQGNERKKIKGKIELFREKGLEDKIPDAEKEIETIKGKLKKIESKNPAEYKLRL